jgi:subtilisin family serine protease
MFMQTTASVLLASLFSVGAFAQQQITYKIPKYTKSPVIESFVALENPAEMLTNDPMLPQQWAIPNSGVGYAWQNNQIGSKKVIVAIVDSGIELSHPDLKANIYVNPRETVNGRDDDGNGYVDDISGWDFLNNNNRPIDELGHGTHVAGIIGAVGNNNIGVTGINQQVSILPLRFMDKEGRGNERAAVAAINYAVKMGATVINCSWGGEGDGAALRAAIQNAQSKGVLVVTASGNDGYNTDSYPSYPSNYTYDNVISVTSINNLDQFPPLTNYGPRSVHIAAPGEKILSTDLKGSYAEMSGTSMAAPYISGAIALIKSIHPDWNYKQLKAELLKYVQVTRHLDRMVASKGRLNVESILTQTVKTYEVPDESRWKTMDMIRESTHPYVNVDQYFSVKIPNAKFIRVIFDRVDFADGIDKVCLTSRVNGIVECINGKKANYVSQYLVGEMLMINMQTNNTNHGWGFKISKVQYIDDL